MEPITLIRSDGLACRELPETRNFSVSAREYLRETINREAWLRGGRAMMEETFRTVDLLMPVDDWLLSRGMGASRENIRTGKLAFYGGLVLVGAILLPGWVMLGVMAVGIGSALYHYGDGLRDYHLAANPFQREAALRKGETAFAEWSVGSFLLFGSQGIPALAGARRIPIPARLATGVQSAARAICLADDPYFLRLATEQGISLLK